jgi:two-component system, sensor histidine kinase and response regulator
LSAIAELVPAEPSVDQSARQDADPIMDRLAALDRINGDTDLFNELQETFMEDCPRRLSQIQAALDRQDLSGVGKAAHTLKGSLGYLGAVQARSCAEELERLAAEGKVADCRKAFAALQSALERLTAAMRAEVEIAAA